MIVYEAVLLMAAIILFAWLLIFVVLWRIRYESIRSRETLEDIHKILDQADIPKKPFKRKQLYKD